MRFGIIGDVHANLEALIVVLEFLEKENVDQIFCLGDIVGYNANPAECIDIIQRAGVICISGNHDRFTAGGIDALIRQETKDVIDFTKKAINEDQMDFLANLPEERTFETIFLFVHGSARHKDEYINTVGVARGNVQHLRKERGWISVCFYGHTHQPFLISPNRIECEIHKDVVYKLDRNSICLINPGSVGQPRDHCPKACFSIFDTDLFEVSIHRLDYDFKTTKQKIIESGIDKRFAERLEVGR